MGEPPVSGANLRARYHSQDPKKAIAVFSNEI